jgi:hypothetical protein
VNIVNTSTSVKSYAIRHEIVRPHGFRGSSNPFAFLTSP